MSNNVGILLVGTGYMGKEYYRVLKALKIEPVVIGRGEKNAAAFTRETGKTVITGGIENALKDRKALLPLAVVAVNVEGMAGAAIRLLESGTKKILLEKPGGMNRGEMQQIAQYARTRGAEVYVGYNRRYYASVKKAEEIIKEDGGIISFQFEFTEWSHSIEGQEHPDEVKENWLLANSSHVIDLAFYLGGNPVEMSSYASGEGILKWHPRNCIYAGAGISDKGALFSYQANWNAPGRWGVELSTPKHRLYLRPLETLQIQKLRSVETEDVELDDRLDQEFKPGLYRQTEAFINGMNDGRLISIEEQLRNMDYYEKIENKG